MNPGPPFAVGDVILCNPPGMEKLQQAYVLESNHPKYKLHLESGRMLGTHAGPKQAWLAPWFAPGEFAPDQDNPFLDIKTERLQMGLFGIHVDSQLDYLWKVQEAKEFTAVKADDVEIPIQLWNNRVMSDSIPQWSRDIALHRFRLLGYKWFRQLLTQDATTYMRCTHGDDWGTGPWVEYGQMTKLGKDWAAIAGMLWHTSHTSWFENHVGLRLVQFRFPPLYRTMDGTVCPYGSSALGQPLERPSH
jgi:hypothetical protein